MGKNGEFDSSTGTHGVKVEKVEGCESMAEGNQQSTLVEWLNVIIPHLNLPLEVSEEELRACLADGTVLCSILNKLSPGLVEMDVSFEPGRANVKRFLAAMDDMGLPSFELSDLEQGYMLPVLQCLRSLRASFSFCGEEDNNLDHSIKSWDVTSEDSALMHHLAQKFHDVLQLKEGCYADVSDDKILEFLNSSSIDNASTKSLFSIVNKILDECTERKNRDVPHRVAWLLRIVMQLIERRTTTQHHNFQNQNSLFRAREVKYKSRVRVLETLVMGTTEEYQVVLKELERIKTQKIKLEQKEKLEEQNVRRLKKENDDRDIEISALKQKLKMARKTNKLYRLQLEEQVKETKVVLEKKLRELELLLIDSKKKVKELESFSESKSLRWKVKECTYQCIIDHQIGVIQDLRVAFESTKDEVLKTKKNYLKEFDRLGLKLRGLIEAAENYQAVLAENRKLYNEVQDLKGNIRVYCRIRPFLPGQSKKQTTMEYIGENGELVVSNPLKHGKDNRRLFKFNKVFGPEASQEEVFLDTRPLIRSVLDGFNVCIFAYGQTGSGKTYTMSGPNISTTEEWGVNYRALNDLFQISESRKNSILYEVGVQMVEIYNEQVHDLLSSDGAQKRLGIWNTTQPNGLAVPEASMYTVKSITDVLELMNIGLMNRAVCATALNERSSRSHSVLTVHVRGTELKTGATLHGSMHLIDLAGSERVHRSEATGDRLREAQHINKSLSALGDVIFALAQKSSHIPYRNSKLTQVLQSSLGGQAKALMFVQLNPDVDSYSETISTLKFAQRVSGIELGAAHSNKEGRDVKELMEQISALKNKITKKEEEIEWLQVKLNGVKHGMSSLRHGSSSLSPRRCSEGSPQLCQRPSEGKGLEETDKAASDIGNCSECSDKHSEAGSHRSMEDIRHQKEWLSPSKPAAGDVSQNVTEDFELLGFGDADSEEKLSDISDVGLSMGTETDGSMNNAIEFTLFPEPAKLVDKSENTEKPSLPSKLTKPPPQKHAWATKSTRFPLTKGSSSKIPSSARKAVAGTSCAARTPKRWQ